MTVSLLVTIDATILPHPMTMVMLLLDLHEYHNLEGLQGLAVVHVRPFTIVTPFYPLQATLQDDTSIMNCYISTDNTLNLLY